MRRKLSDEDISVLPPSMQVRNDLDEAARRIAASDDETTVRTIIAEINEKIREVNRSVVSGPPTTLGPLDVERIVERGAPSGPPTGLGALGHRVARDPGVPHDPGLVRGRRAGRCSTQRLSQTTTSPTLPVGARTSAAAGRRSRASVGEQRLRLVLVEAGDAVGVAADEERRAARDGMDLHQRPQRRRPVVEAVARRRSDHVTPIFACE